jgi:hypothetical protein
MRVVSCQLYAPTSSTPREYSWYSFLLDAESTPWPKRGRKDYVNGTIGNRTRDLPAFSAIPQRTAPTRTKQSITSTVYLYCFPCWTIAENKKAPIVPSLWSSATGNNHFPCNTGSSDFIQKWVNELKNYFSTKAQSCSQSPATPTALEIFVSFREIEYGFLKHAGTNCKWVILLWSQFNAIHCVNSLYGYIQQMWLRLATKIYPLSYGVPVRERYGSTLLPATREQHDQNCTQSH